MSTSGDLSTSRLTSDVRVLVLHMSAVTVSSTGAYTSFKGMTAISSFNCLKKKLFQSSKNKTWGKKPCHDLGSGAKVKPKKLDSCLKYSLQKKLDFFFKKNLGKRCHDLRTGAKVGVKPLEVDGLEVQPHLCAQCVPKLPCSCNVCVCVCLCVCVCACVCVRAQVCVCAHDGSAGTSIVL